MANELKHVSVGTSLTQDEYESVTGHAFESQATGDTMYASSATQLSRLGIGSAGQVLRIASGLPAWSTATFPGTGGASGTWLRSDGTNIVNSTTTLPDTAAVSTILYASAANVISALATASSGVLVTSGAGVPSISGVLPAITLGGTVASNGQSFSGTIASLGTVTTVTINGGTITGITDLAVADGGTGSSTAAAARTALGVVIGTDVQAYDAQLADVAGLAVTDNGFIVGNGSNFVAESGATARTSLGLGTFAVENIAAVPAITLAGTVSGGGQQVNNVIIGTTSPLAGTFTAVGVGAALTDGVLHVQSGTAGVVAAANSQAAIESSGDSGLSILSPAANVGAVFFGSPTAAQRGRIYYDHGTGTGGAADQFVFFAASAERVRIGTGGLYINDSSNANATLGLTINQGAADNEILSLKSSDVAHGMTGLTETDTYAFFQKNAAAAGGLLIAGFLSAGTAALTLFGVGVTDNTSKTTGGANAYVTIQASKKNGTSHADPGANANIFLVEDGNTGNAKFMVDEDGDLFAVNIVTTAFDSEDDVSLVRAYELTRTNKGIIKTHWDDFVRGNENDLVRLGVIGASIAEGGLWNVTQHMRLLNGAAWQTHIDLMEIAAVLPDTIKARLPERIRSKLAALPA